MSFGVRKGAWTKEEDVLLSNCVEKHGEGKWHLVPLEAGLNRCRKSCRLRWLNYLKPNIKRGEFSKDEVDLMIRLHRILGNRWSLIAGRLPGRTANDVKNYWNTKLRHMVSCRKEGMPKVPNASQTVVIKPQPWTFYKSPSGLKLKTAVEDPIKSPAFMNEPLLTLLQPDRGCNTWWESLLADLQDDQGTKFSDCGPQEPKVLADAFEDEPHIGQVDFSFDADLWDILNA